jgi:hypothetical protein
VTPWQRMLRHPALWAIVINNFTFHYAFYVIMNWMPTYFDKVCFWVGWGWGKHVSERACVCVLVSLACFASMLLTACDACWL